MRRVQALMLLAALMSASAMAAPVHAQRGTSTRPEPARQAAPPAERPSFVVPTLVGVASAAVIILVVCLPSRRAPEKDGKP